MLRFVALKVLKANFIYLTTRHTVGILNLFLVNKSIDKKVLIPYFTYLVISGLTKLVLFFSFNLIVVWNENRSSFFFLLTVWRSSYTGSEIRGIHA